MHTFVLCKGKSSSTLSKSVLPSVKNCQILNTVLPMAWCLKKKTYPFQFTCHMVVTPCCLLKDTLYVFFPIILRECFHLMMTVMAYLSYQILLTQYFWLRWKPMVCSSYWGEGEKQERNPKTYINSKHGLLSWETWVPMT